MGASASVRSSVGSAEAPTPRRSHHLRSVFDGLSAVKCACTRERALSTFCSRVRSRGRTPQRTCFASKALADHAGVLVDPHFR
eukprot:scaffold462_cov195-Pinguiococcus_pyrenoidosus.AAC.33